MDVWRREKRSIERTIWRDRDSCGIAMRIGRWPRHGGSHWPHDSSKGWVRSRRSSTYSIESHTTTMSHARQTNKLSSRAFISSWSGEYSRHDKHKTNAIRLTDGYIRLYPGQGQVRSSNPLTWIEKQTGIAGEEERDRVKQGEVRVYTTVTLLVFWLPIHSPTKPKVWQYLFYRADSLYASPILGFLLCCLYTLSVFPALLAAASSILWSRLSAA